MSEFSEEVETLRKQLLEKELELKEKDELLKRWEGAVAKPDGSSYGLQKHHYLLKLHCASDCLLQC